MDTHELTRISHMADALVMSLEALLVSEKKYGTKITSLSSQNDLTAVLKSQVREAKFKRSIPCIDDVFTKYAADDRGIPRLEFFDAIQEVRFDFTNDDDAKVLFESMDMDNDGFLNIDEFRRAVQSRSEMEQFISNSIPVVEVISAALPRVDSKSPMDVFRTLTPVQITAISNAVAEGLALLLAEKIASLNEGFAAAEAKKNVSGGSGAKFAIFELSAGSIHDYHKGLSSRVGN